MTTKKPAAKKEKAVEAAPATAAPKLVKMTRNGKFADVHPAEVDNFKGGGWVEA